MKILYSKDTLELVTGDSIYVKNLTTNALDSISYAVKRQTLEIKQLSNIIESSQNDDKFLDWVTYDTIFTVICTLLVLILGIIIDRLIKFYDKKSDERKLRQYFQSYLNKISDKFCPQISKMYKDFYQQTNIETGISSTPPKVLTGDFQRIKNIEDKDLFHSIKEKQTLSSLLSNLDFLEKLIDEVESYHKRARDENDGIRVKLQEMINNYIDLIANYLEYVKKENPSYPGKDDFIALINNSIYLYHDDIKSKDRKLRRLYKEIVRPIQEMVILKNIFRTDLMAFEISERGKELSYQYNYLRRISIGIQLQYRKFYQHTVSSHNKLIEERKKIKW